MKICVVGLGYVGLPLSLVLSNHFDVVGFDVDTEKISNLKQGKDISGEVDLENCSVEFSTDVSVIKDCDFVIVCIPTPTDSANNPDLSLLRKASEMIGANLKSGAVVVYESTVYPGATEEICVPILEKCSNMKLGSDFGIGYSPERINPGDKKKTIDKVVKVVSGSDINTLDIVDSVYSKITDTYRATSIKVAEAAKVIENVQRDLNIALMNELAVLFDKLDINVNDVLDAASTKWNWHDYKPGLVGGHCIPVDPYYLTYKAVSVGHHPEVILSGRRINDNMHNFYAEKIVKRLISAGKRVSDSRVLILGLTFKANVRDYRNSRVKNLIDELKSFGAEVVGCDPLLDDSIIEKVFGVETVGVNTEADLVLLAVEHDEFKDINREIVRLEDLSR
tara:strand:+ start:2490 stop:3668 length:1179 start_codon:yes stop_codon:yes gene_type:complete